MARNRTFNEISIGDTATIHRVCTANDLVIFAHASGNLNPLSLPHDQDRDGHTDPDTIAPSMWVGSQISLPFLAIPCPAPARSTAARR
jgi:hypothetical protein